MNLTDVNNYLLVQNNLQHNDLLYLLNIISSSQMDYGDIYFQLKFHESWILEDNIVKSGSYNSLQGAGIRVITGEQTGFAYTNNLTFDSLTRTAIAAKSIKNTDYNNTSCINRKKIILSNHQPISIYSQDNPILSTSNEEKIELLMQINKIARITDTRVKKVVARLSSTYEYILVISTDGILATDVRPLTKLSIVVQVEHNGKREQGFGGGGGRFGCEFFQEKIMGESRVEKWTRDAVNMGIVNLFSVEAPAGLMPVILGPGWPGILIHEAIGHGLEGDFNRCKTSIFFDKLGTRVASDLCTIVDDATYAGLRGSLNIDDEGVSGQCTVLIQNGILKRYMQDKLNSRLMNEFSTGNGRRESYAHLPMPRMTNTYMLAGKTTPEEIIDSVDYGIYAPNFGGGQVDITSGKFVFSIIEAYLIENGRMTKPIKGATLIGSGMEVMQNISMVGNNLLLDNGSGTCIKYGQGIPVSVGQPTIKLDKITVGGTN